MRDPNRIKPFLAKLEELWLQHPDLRFGQMVAWITPGPDRLTEKQPAFHAEDPDWQEELEYRLVRFGS
jgi:hypothetical protein